ncbi:HAMP domain-containing sensor histidine kinase [Clostridium sp.]|uniref:sensor histidine kinase n=1 Tax=Clostridium sp. TaxID=1506 RepID=UPI003216ACE3
MSINVTNIIIFNILSFICIRFKYISFYKSFNSDKDLSLTLKSLKEINYKLLESDKNRTDFFANMSHELKTPINVIYGAEQLLAQQFKNEDINIKKSETYVKSIKQNSYRLIRLLNNILDITKIDSSAYDIKLENIDIIYTVETIVDSVAEFIKSKGLNIIFDTNVEEKIIAIDEDKLERIILNLLSNAIKFTDAGGTIFINMYEEKDYMTISVKDTGIGIDDSMKKAIFDRFIQIDKSMSRNSEGSGIGLSLVKSLVNMHEGKINLISSPGEGSEFIISFPDIKINSFNDTNKFLIKKPHNNKISKIQVEFSDIYQ